jgi:invasion protein IalB
MGSVSPGALFLTIKSLVAVVAIASVAVGPPSHANAQAAVKSVHNDWQVRCDTPPGAQGEQCALVQSVTAEDRPDVSLTVTVSKTADQKSRLLRVVVPMGVLLPAGLRLKINQTDVGKAGFVRCLRSGCVAEVVMDDNLINRLRTGETVPDEGIGLPISLKGFAEAYDELP